MPEVILNDNNFEQEVIKSDIPVLVDFWAPWCAPCMMIAPVIEELAQEYEGQLKVCRLNVDEVPQAASRFQIMAIPSLLIFKEGQPVEKIVGVIPKERIVSKLQAYLG
ncbi:MAG: thioredoxin [Candidatus Omnitrophica bacterium]|nr:thioredoxin [Candidatus Omnitrophota bacterium]